MVDFSGLNSAVLDVFAEPAESDTIGGVPVQAIFDSRHFADETGETGASDLITTISVRTADLPALSDSTVVVVRGVSYRVWESRPDGQGMTTLALERLA